jgi:hypothetical protein
LINIPGFAVAVIVLCAPDTDEHNFLLRAEALGMLNNEYLYVTIDHLKPVNIQTPWKTGGKSNEAARRLYRSVIEARRRGI